MSKIEWTDDTYQAWDQFHGGQGFDLDEPRWKISKKAAGRLLDSREWDESTEVDHV